jgi:hypothetical protein
MPGKKGCLHRAYLLRCWQEREASTGEKSRWRFCVEEVLQERHRQGFDSLDALVTFLHAELGDPDMDRSGSDGSNKEMQDD